MIATRWRTGYRPICAVGRPLQPRHLSDDHEVDKQSRLVVPNDLTATLEAHRAFNLQQRIRKQKTWSRNRRPTKPFNDSDAPPQGPAKSEVGKIPTSTPMATSTAVSTKQPDPVRKNLRRPMEQSIGRRFSRSESESKTKVRRKKTDLELERKLDVKGIVIHPLNYHDALPYKPYLHAAKHEPRLIIAHDAILRLESWISLSPAELDLRATIMKDAIKTLKGDDEDVAFKPFDISVTPIQDPTSVINLYYTIESLDATSRASKLKEHVVDKVSVFKRNLATNTNFQEILPKSDLNPPCLRFQHQPTGLWLRVIPALKSSREDEAASMLNSYIHGYPQLSPLYHVIKLALWVRNLSNGNEEHLEPYALVTMIVTYLRLSKHHHEDSLATFLLGFLNFFAKFNTDLYGLSAEPPEQFQKISSSATPSLDEKAAMKSNEILRGKWAIRKRKEANPHLLCLQDPVRPFCDLGAHLKRIMDIRATFGYLAGSLREYLDSKSSGKESHDPLEPFFGYVLADVRERRRRALAWWMRQQPSRTSFDSDRDATQGVNEQLFE